MQGYLKEKLGWRPLKITEDTLLNPELEIRIYIIIRLYMAKRGSNVDVTTLSLT